MTECCPNGQCERLPENRDIICEMNAQRAEIERLRRDCAELYQVIGTMAESCIDPDAGPIIKALDNASAAENGDPRPHDDLLPFIIEQTGD